MRMEIFTGTKEQFQSSIKSAATYSNNLAAYYTSILQEASDRQVESISLQGLPLQEKNSANFQSMGIMEKTIVEFLRTHEFPRKVIIFTGCEEASAMYRVVYNFWYASEKPDRMEDETFH